MRFPCLRLVGAEGFEQTYELSTRETLVGRKSDNHIVLVDPYISRHHARIVKENDGYHLVDLQSMHGTFVNDRRVDRYRLSHGERIRLGRVELLYLSQPGDITESITTAAEDLEKSLAHFSSAFTSQAYSQYSDLEKITWILDFQYQWGQQFSWERMFNQILRSALTISGAERGFVMVKQNENFEYAAGLTTLGNVLSDSEFRTSQGVVQRVAEGGQPVFMTEGIDGELAQQKSIQEMKLRAVACMPLGGISAHSEQPDLLGILYLDSTKPMHTLSGLDEKILNKLAAEAGNVLEKLEMIKSIDERRRFEQELSLAYETQQSLLPQSLPHFQNLQIFAFSEPTRYVGGDFYDFLQVRRDELIGVLADVSGKGLSAALLSSLLQGALDMECRSGAPLGEVVERVNKLLCERSPANRFVTLFVFSLNGQGRGEFVNGGHNPPYIFRASRGTIEELESDGLIVGAFDFASYSSRAFQFEGGDILVAYSDGITDASNPEGDLFGDTRLKQIIQEHGAAGAEVLEKMILDGLEEFTQGMAQTDDMTLVLVEFHSSSQKRLPVS